MMNLDYHAEQCAQAVLAATKGLDEKVENVATKALGALEERGVYSCMLFLLSRKREEKRIADQIAGPLRQLVADSTGIVWKGTTVDEVLGTIHEQISTDLDTLLLVRDLWQQSLIYIRFAARARKPEPEAKNS